MWVASRSWEKSGKRITPRSSWGECSSANTLISAQTSVGTYASVSLSVCIVLCHYVCDDLLQQQWETNINTLSKGQVRVCAQSCLTLCNPMDCSPPGSSVHRILQARILEWIAISGSGGSSQPRAWARVSHVSCTGKWILYHCSTWKVKGQVLGDTSQRGNSHYLWTF